MKRIAVISFFPAFQPPTSGGELRLYNIHKRLAAAGHKVTLVAPTYSDHPMETIRHSRNFIERRIPKSPLYNQLHGVMDRFAGFRECSGLVCSLAANRHKELRRAVSQACRNADVIIHESPFLAPLLPKKKRPGQTIVYNSYNCEARLAEDMFPSGASGFLARQRVKQLERKMCRTADIIFACSEEDADDLCRYVGADGSKILIVPNGVDTKSVKPATAAERHEARRIMGLSEDEQVAFFIGSAHPPNMEAVTFIRDESAAQNPTIKFFIAGNVCEKFSPDDFSPNVQLLGRIDDQARQHLFAAADVALNPMRSGSGTNLKMLDFLASGLPILTTRFGARGLDLDEDHDCRVADLSAFSQELKTLLSSNSERAQLASNARAHATASFDWDPIAVTVVQTIQHRIDDTKRLAILCDYSVSDSLHGGAVRVRAIADVCQRLGIRATLLTLHGDGYGRTRQLSPLVEERQFQRPWPMRRIDIQLARLLGCGADDAATLILGRWFLRSMRSAVRRELQQSSAILLEHPFSYSLLPKQLKATPIIFDAHNVEFALKQKLYKVESLSRPRRMLATYLIRRIAETEERLTEQANFVMAVSHETADGLSTKANLVAIAPNGIDTASIQIMAPNERERMRTSAGLPKGPLAIFLGSAHPPNAEAVRFINKKIAPTLSNVNFLILGACTEWFAEADFPENVLPFGRVSDAVKSYLLQCSDVALNPMFTGSGTSLKVFDYLAHGLPVVTTAIGVRGVDEETPAILLTESDDFTSALEAFLCNHQNDERLRKVARHFAETHYDWSITLKPLEEVLKNIFITGK